MNLTDCGYNELWKAKFASIGRPDTRPARVIAQHRDYYALACEDGERLATLSGRLRAAHSEDFPGVGDFVAMRASGLGEASIDAILPRATCFARLDGWRGTSQVLAANIDTALLCVALVGDFSVPRIERYLTLGKQSGARLAILLTKADLAGDYAPLLDQALAVCASTPVHAISAATGQGMQDIAHYFAAGQTVAALGSSGVGKSTLVNALYGGQLMHTAAVRGYDGKGRHTTVHRQLLALPGGGLYLDMPGLREVGLADAEAGVDDAFSEIARLATECRFGDCRHDGEPGCAVRAAVAAGQIDPARLKRYQGLRREAAHRARKHRRMKE